ncbi:MAG: hypothetical protein FWF29_03780, partial [Treponema sp.]|nr:hypothetical protein [Treponema sp.]
MAGIENKFLIAFPLMLAACMIPGQNDGAGSLRYRVVKSSLVDISAAELQITPASGDALRVNLLDAFAAGGSAEGEISLKPGVARLRFGFLSAGSEAVKTYNVNIAGGKQSSQEVLLTSSDFSPVEKLWLSGSALPSGAAPEDAVEMTNSGAVFGWAGILHAGNFRILAGDTPLSLQTSSVFMPSSGDEAVTGGSQAMAYRAGIAGSEDTQWSIAQPLYYRITVDLPAMTITAEALNTPGTGKKAPMYWTVYEYHREREYAGVDANDNYIPEDILKQNIDWVAYNLLPYGFDMVCMDGWGGGGYIPTNINGYRTKHSVQWEHDYAYWAEYLKQKGMTLGVYWNPLWVDQQSATDGKKVWNTDMPIADIYDPDEWNIWGFHWACVDRPGAEEYIKGCVKYYADMGVSFLRVDFLSWYETGLDRNLGVVGKTDRPRSDYETALRWMREACDEYGVFLSLVMPNLKNNAELEKQYGGSYRINGDTLEGQWKRLSEDGRGNRTVDIWSQFENPFDGFTYWSQFDGAGEAVMDGDFLRLNTFANDEERRTAV